MYTTLYPTSNGKQFIEQIVNEAQSIFIARQHTDARY